MSFNNLFKALSDATGGRSESSEGKDMTAGRDCWHFDISKASISHHLNILKHADLISD